MTSMNDHISSLKAAHIAEETRIVNEHTMKLQQNDMNLHAQMSDSAQSIADVLSIHRANLSAQEIELEKKESILSSANAKVKSDQDILDNTKSSLESELADISSHQDSTRKAYRDSLGQSDVLQKEIKDAYEKHEQAKKIFEETGAKLRETSREYVRVTGHMNNLKNHGLELDDNQKQLDKRKAKVDEDMKNNEETLMTQKKELENLKVVKEGHLKTIDALSKEIQTKYAEQHENELKHIELRKAISTNNASIATAKSQHNVQPGDRMARLSEFGNIANGYKDRAVELSNSAAMISNQIAQMTGNSSSIGIKINKINSNINRLNSSVNKSNATIESLKDVGQTLQEHQDTHNKLVEQYKVDYSKRQATMQDVHNKIDALNSQGRDQYEEMNIHKRRFQDSGDQLRRCISHNEELEQHHGRLTNDVEKRKMALDEVAKAQTAHSMASSTVGSRVEQLQAKKRDHTQNIERYNKLVEQYHSSHGEYALKNVSIYSHR